MRSRDRETERIRKINKLEFRKERKRCKDSRIKHKGIQKKLIEDPSLEEF